MRKRFWLIFAVLPLAAVLCFVGCEDDDDDGLAPITSTFDTDADAWRTTDGATLSPLPTFVATGGNPGGFIRGVDGDGSYWYWDAPGKFLGNRLSSYGRILSFDLRQHRTDSPAGERPDIILTGPGGTQLVYNTAPSPGSNWTSYSVVLVETAGWLLQSDSSAATRSLMQTVLGALTRLRIRAEFRSGVDTNDLDNALLQQ